MSSRLDNVTISPKTNITMAIGAFGVCISLIAGAVMWGSAQTAAIDRATVELSRLNGTMENKVVPEMRELRDRIIKLESQR